MIAYMYTFQQKSTGYKYAVAATDSDTAWEKLEDFLDWDETTNYLHECYHLIEMDVKGVTPL